MSLSASFRRPEALARVARIAAALTAVTGGVVLLGWLFDLPALQTFALDGRATMPNTALSFICCGVALWLLQQPKPGLLARGLARTAAALVAMFALLTLSQYLFAWNLGIDELLLHVPGGVADQVFPGRVAPNTTVCLLVVGAALLVFGGRKPGAFPRLFVQCTAVFVVWSGLLAIVSHVVNLTGTYHWLGFDPMALNSAGVLIVLGVGLFAGAIRDGALQWSLETPTTLAFAAGLLLLNLLSGLTHENTQETKKAERWLAHTHEVRFHVSELLSGVKDVETGERGFLLTGQDGFLSPYQTATNTVRVEFAKLRELTADNPEQQARLQALEPVLATLLEAAAGTLQLRQSKGVEAAAALVRIGQGKALMDEVRQRLAALDAAETRLVEISLKVADQDNRKTLLLLRLGETVTLAVFLAVIFLLNHAAGERRQAEAAMRESQEQFQIFFEQADVGMSLTRLSGETQANPALCNLLGYSLAELRGKTWQEITHPEDIAATEREIATLLSGARTSARFTKRYLHKQGQVVWGDLSTTLRRDTAGQPMYFMTAIVDVTERKQAEEKLRKGERQLRESQRVARLGSWDLDLVTPKLDWSEVTYELFDQSWETFTPSFDEFARLVHPEDRPTMQSKWDRALASDASPYHIVVRIVNDSGREWVMEAFGSVRRDDQGRPLHIFGTAQDITERKQAEEALQASEERFRIAAETANDMVYDWSLKEDVQWFGKIDELLGYAPGEFPRTLTAWAAAVHPEDLERTMAAVQAHLEGRAPYVMEYRIRRQDGVYRWWAARGAASRTPEGKPLRMIGSITDITERKRDAETKARLAAIVEFSEDAIYGLGLDSVITSWNQSAEKLFGYTASEMVGTPNLRLIPAERQAEEAQILDTIQRGEPVRHYETVRLTKAGRRVAVSLTASPIQDATGKVVGVSKVARDITERKRRQAILEARVRLNEFAPGHSLEELLTRTLDECEQLTGSTIGFFHFVEADQITLALQTWSTNTLQNMCTAEGKGRHYPMDQAGVWVDALRERRPVIHNDYAHLPQRKGLPPGHAAVVRELVVPILRQEQVVAILGVGNKPGDYEPPDVDSVAQLAGLAWDIVGAKRAEEALQQNQRLLTETESVGKVGGWEFNIDTGQQTWTEEIYRIHELEITGQPTVEQGMNFYTLASRPIIEQAVRRAIKQGEPFDLDLEIITAKGNLRNIHTIGKADLAHRRIYGFFQDITARKRAEETLRNVSAYTRSLIEASLDPLVTISSEGKITDVNEASVQATGVPREQLIGTDFSDYFSEPAKAREGYQQVFAKGFVQDYPLAIRHVSGRVTDVLYNAALYRNAEGQTSGVFAAARDVTERKRAEAALRRLNRELRAITSCNQASLRAVEEPTLLQQVCQILCAEVGYRMAWVGYAEADAAQSVRPVAWAGVEAGYLTNANITWADTDRGRGPTGTAVRTGTPVHLQDFTTDPCVAPWREPALARGYRSSIALPLKDERGTTFGAFTIYAGQPNAFTPDELQLLESLANDLAFGINALRTRAERQRAEGEIRELNASLERKVAERTTELVATNKELESFAYSISHDLRAPLRAIDGFSRVLLEDYAPRLDAEGQDSLHRVRGAAQRMGRLIDALLMLSRITREPMQVKSVDLSALARDVAGELALTAPERVGTWVIAPDVKVAGEARLLRIVLENLLGNAWKFTSQAAAARIEFGRAEHLGGPVCFVRDNGAGFDMTYADKLFGAFQRLHTTSEFPGTGIGLATVQRIIHRHGGRVWAEAKVGQGATFYFTLPPPPTSGDYDTTMTLKGKAA